MAESGSQDLTATEVAARAGVDVADVERMAALGLLSPGEGRFGAGDVRRVLVGVACERAGLPLDAIAESVRDRRLSFAFLDAPTYRRWAERSSRTYREVADEAGIPFGSMRATLEAMGFAPMEPDDRMREDELETVPLLRLSLGSGVVDEAWFVRLGRAYADGIRRLTQAENEVYHERFEQPFLDRGMTQAEAMETASAMAGQYNDLVDRTLLAMIRRHQELQWTEHLVEHIEDDLERTGRLGRPERLPAMAFVDLAGYTRLTEERGDAAAAEAASAFAVIVEREARARGGTPVKWLGDGVMVAFRDSGGAVAAALSLVDVIPGAGLPPIHVGIAAGRVVAYAGDYFGRTVNMAARLSARAAAGQVLVNDAAADALRADARIRCSELGSMDLKGFADSVRVFEAAADGPAPRLG
jgi:class 3 adenylate cyclase